jgi:hypothetical protein
MKFQLVLQMPASSLKDYDEMIQLEEMIIGGLGVLGTVDGHDAGSGEMNIFVLTDHPHLAFERIGVLLGTKDFMPDLKVAFREVGKNQFAILYPSDLRQFSIKGAFP